MTTRPARRTAVPRRGVERELREPVLLCDERGRLRPDAVGWSRRPLHTCNLTGHAPRKKRWNYWCAANDSVLFSATVADVDHYVAAFVYFFEFATQRFIEKTAVTAAGSIDLPPTVAGDVVFDRPELRVAMTREGTGTRIRVDCPDFGGEAMLADLRVRRPLRHETLNVVIPWSPTRFQFTSKQNCLPVTGAVTLGPERHHLRGPRAFACMDFGRGVWKARTAWNWGSCSARLPDGRTFGLNLGGAWTDGTGMTENGIVLDGRISKLAEDLAFEYDRWDFMKPWRIRARSRRIDLRFVPFYERVARADLDVLFSEVHQMFGRYTGAIVAGSGERVELEDAFGWIEEHRARW